MIRATEGLGSVTAQFRAEVLRGGPGVIDGLAAEWSALCDARREAPFYRPEWIRAYLRAFAPRAEVVLVTSRAAGRLGVVLPLIAELGTLGGLPVRKLRTAGNTHTCRYELISDPDAGEGALYSALAALLDEPGWDVLEMENAPRGGALAQLVQLAAQQGCRTHAAAVLTPPYLDLTPCEGQFERLLDRLDAKFRSNLRRRMRKLAAHGAVRLAHSTRDDGRLQQFYALERSGWKGAERSAIACDDTTRSFYDEIAREAEHGGSLSLYALECGGRPVAMHFGLYREGRYHLLKTAYDEALRDCSPGQLLTHEALRDLVARGCREFDFVGGAAGWKSDWAPQSRPLDDLYVFRGWVGSALHALRFRLRPAVARAVRTIAGVR